VTTSLATRPRPLPATLEALRLSLLGEGWTASSPTELDDEAEQLARQERWTEALTGEQVTG
jgi:hypothetical protein